MSQNAAEELLADMLVRWDQDDDRLKLGREFVNRLDLACERQYGSFARQVAKLVNRKLKVREKDVLDYFYDNLCSEDSKNSRPRRYGGGKLSRGKRKK